MICADDSITMPAPLFAKARRIVLATMDNAPLPAATMAELAGKLSLADLSGTGCYTLRTTPEERVAFMALFEVGAEGSLAISDQEWEAMRHA